jgi:hypothetical protein
MQQGMWLSNGVCPISSNSLFRPDPARYHALVQQFKGWEIDTAQSAFNPQLATFLDFRTPQERGTHFFYVLPSSEHHALVESVLCATAPLGWAYCEQALHRYLERVLASQPTVSGARSRASAP